MKGFTNCAQCQNDIPLEAALTPEGMEYVQYFCGLDCVDRFLNRAKAVANMDVMLASQRSHDIPFGSIGQRDDVGGRLC